MKKTIAILILAAAAMLTASAQTTNSTLSQLSSLASSISVQYTETATTETYAVTVPKAAAGVLAGAQRDGEAKEDYARRAFLAGAVGLMNQKAMLAARAGSLSNQLAQSQAKLQSDIATAQARQLVLSNQLNSVAAQLK